MAKSLPRKILKVFLWIFGIIIGLFLLVFIALQIPAVQQYVAGKVVDVANENLGGGELGLGGIDLDFPTRIQLEDVYLNNPEGDSIARIGHFGVGINMLSLIRSRLVITDVVLRDVYANVVTTDSSSNIQFLLDLGATDSLDVEVDSLNSPDNAITVDTTAADTTSGGGFQIIARGTKLTLTNADLYYQDDPTGILADVVAPRLAGELNELDLENQVYDIDYLELEDAKALIGIGESSTPADTTESEAAEMLLKAGRVTISKTRIDLELTDLALSHAIPYVNLEGAELALGEELRFNGELFQLRDFAFSLDGPQPELQGPGIDYNHLALTDVQAEATDIAYIGDSLHLIVRQLSGAEKSGLTLERTEGTVIYDPQFLGLENFVLKTTNSRLASENTAVRYDFAGGNLDEMLAQADLDGHVGLADVIVLAPQLREAPIVRGNLRQRFDFSLRAEGSMAQLNLPRIRLDGPGVKVRANGRVENVLDAERLAGRLFLREFSVIPGPLLPLVPAGMLPPDIDWPDRVFAEGQAQYRNGNLQLNLYAVENREFGNGLQTRVRTNGVIEGVANFPNTRLDVTLDTALVTRPTILAYLPPGSLPEDYTIPDFVRASGTVVGPMDDLTVNVRIAIPGDQTYANLDGRIRNVLDPKQLDLDLAVSDLGINIADVEAILPDSTLPANINLPDLRIRNATIKGSLDNLTFDVPLETDNGIWQIDGRYNPEDLDVHVDVKGVRLAELFTGALGDTLAGLELGALNIEATAKGRLQPTMSLDVVAAIGNDSLGEFVNLVADVDQDNYAASFELTHPDMLATGEGSYAIGPDSVAKVAALVDVENLNLEYWEITQLPMLVEGRLEARATGLDPYAMEAYARLDSVELRGRDGSSFIDSLVATASLQNRDNEILIRSDVLDAELIGVFDPVETPSKLVTFIMGYWDESLERIEPVEDGESMDFVLELKRPQPLTGGLVNGLRELSPMRASLLYRDAEPELLVSLDLAEVNYAGVEARDLALRVIGDTDNLNVEADWSDIVYGEQFDFGRTRITGETTPNDELLVELKMYSDNDSLRHYLGLVTDPVADSIVVRLEPEQILNFETWTVPRTNRVAMVGNDLRVEDMELRNGNQLLAAETTEPGDVEVRFEDFDLRTPSRLIVSEREFLGGIVNGTVGLDNVLTNLGIQSDLRVDDFMYEGQKVGDIDAQVNSANELVYEVDVALTDAGNEANVDGTVELNGPLNLVVDLKKLPLTTAEPFSIGYLKESEGYLSGRIDVGGTMDAPTLNGSARFNNASLIISLLGERFKLDDQPIQFNNRTINFGNDWKIFDSRGGTARVQGQVEMQSLTEQILDLNIEADNFLAVNSEEEDNEDWYGFMPVDATVDITGTALVPVVDVKATTVGESNITYVYRLPEDGLVDNEFVRYAQMYQWQDQLRRTELTVDTQVVTAAGMDLTLELAVNPELEVTVIVDPVTGQSFVGRAEGDLTMKMYPDGRQEMVGRVELTEGKYDFVYQVIRKEFDVLPGSSVNFTGDLLNPQMNLNIRHVVKTSPLPLVEGILGPGRTVDGLSRTQTFYVDVNLTGDLQASDIKTDIKYPEDAFGNLALAPVNDALQTLRQDESRMTTQSFQLLAFGSFNIPLLDAGGGGPGLLATTLTGVMDKYLNNWADQLVGFVDLDFGLDSYNDESGQTQTNLRVSLRKTLFDDRVIVSVDGVAGTEEDQVAGNQQTYLNNITAEYLINEDGTFRLKFFQDNDRNNIVGQNVVRFGGRLTFGRDFNSLGWGKKDRRDDEQR